MAEWVAGNPPGIQRRVAGKLARSKSVALAAKLFGEPRARWFSHLIISASCAQVPVRDAGRGAVRRPPRSAAAGLPLPLLLRGGGGGVPRPRQARSTHAGSYPTPAGPRLARRAALARAAPAGPAGPDGAPAAARAHRSAAPAAAAPAAAALGARAAARAATSHAPPTQPSPRGLGGPLR